MIPSLCGLALICFASAQLSFGARVSYDPQEKATAVFSYTHGMAINTPSEVYLTSNNGSSSKYAAAVIKYNFKTFNLVGQYALVGGGKESAGKFYGIVGAGELQRSHQRKLRPFCLYANGRGRRQRK